MADNPGAGISNSVSGGTQFGPVFQGRDFDVTVRPAAAAPVAMAQLPLRAAGFTGRDDELQSVISVLDPFSTAGAVVVSAVAGLAGVGKTALAVAAGHAVRERGWFGGGVLFIDLHGYDEAPVEPGQALDALLRALGVPAEHIPPGTEERAGLYRSVLAQVNEPVLVIADNASSEAQVRPLLPGAGPHRVVVTSRHTLARLDARLLDVRVLDDTASVELLDTALRAARPDDDRISNNRDTAARLARICGGLPLALQIVAAILKADPARTVTEIADDLDAGQKRLERLQYDEGSAGGTASVVAAFDLSYRRLDKASAQLFQLLPLNPGPDVGTGAVVALAELPLEQARETLASLTRAHLIEGAPGAPGRWRMHDLVQLYAQRLRYKQSDAESREQARDRLLGYYRDMAYAADQHVRSLPGVLLPDEFTGRADALAWLDAERPSLVGAVTMAADTGRDSVAMMLPISLAEYFDWRHRFDEKVATLTISREAARRLGGRPSEGGVLATLGYALEQAGRFEEAITALQEAAAILRETGDRHTEGGALVNLGRALREVERVEEAITALQDAVAIFRETGDRHLEGLAVGNIGETLMLAGRFEEAIIALQDAAAIFRETGNRHAIGFTASALGQALEEAGRFEEAITPLQEAVAIFKETGDRHREGWALVHLGRALREVQQFEEAITALQDAVAIFEETGDQPRADALRQELAGIPHSG